MNKDTKPQKSSDFKELNKHTPVVETRPNVGYPDRGWPTLQLADQGSETREIGRDDPNQSWLNDLFKTAPRGGRLCHGGLMLLIMGAVTMVHGFHDNTDLTAGDISIQTITKLNRISISQV
jgi:hypothetical protein